MISHCNYFKTVLMRATGGNGSTESWCYLKEILALWHRPVLEHPTLTGISSARSSRPVVMCSFLESLSLSLLSCWGGGLGNCDSWCLFTSVQSQIRGVCLTFHLTNHNSALCSFKAAVWLDLMRRMFFM